MKKLLALLVLVPISLTAQTIRPTRISQIQWTELTTAQEASMTLLEGSEWYNTDLNCFRQRLASSSVCFLTGVGPTDAVVKTPTGNQSITGGFSLSLDGSLIFPEDGAACTFQQIPGVSWEICSNFDTLQIEHFNSGGVGRMQVNADFLVGPPGSATVSENFNSFAWDNEGSYWDGSQAQFNLWEIAVGTTPDSGTPINSRLNMWPLFTGACAGCTADIALGASGTNLVRGNPTGPPMWIFNILPRDGFSATFAHSGFTANRIYIFPDATGTIPLLELTQTFSADQIFSGIRADRLVIGGGAGVVSHLSGTTSLNFGALAANSCETLTLAVVGATGGSSVVLGIPDALADVDGATERTTFFGWVSSAGIVSVRRCNVTGTVTINPAAAIIRADVWEH